MHIFFFEGQFRRDAYPEYAGKKFFANALVPYADERQAYEILKQELDADHIDIIGIEDQFIFDPSKIEAASKAPENLTWLSLYEEVKRFNTTIFTPMHMFEEDDSTPVEDP